jgi:hypothetical protein
VELLVIGFESGVVEVVLAVFEIFVPDAVPAATVPTTVKVVVLPELNVPSVHCRVTVNAGRHDQAVPV